MPAVTAGGAIAHSAIDRGQASGSYGMLRMF